LVRSWTHLERQRGGSGFLGGPGETQIELDRRHIDNRILKIKKELEKVKKTRGIQRASRVRVPFDVVSLVGYTNAGKSTLFNYITKENVFAKDMLFATLDPTMRKIKLSPKNEVILSDTVGFISNLPHELVMAFRATLEEVLEANIILHVIDVSNPNYKEQRKDVLSVLHELGLDKIEYQDNYIEVYNKIDLLSDDKLSYFKEKNKKNNVMISAFNGKGVDELLNMLDDKTSNKSEVVDFEIDISNGKELAKIYRDMYVLDRVDDLNNGKIYIKARKIIK
jgi:GTP-binding protein HflX